MNFSVKKVVYSGLFLALGVLFPQVFHLFGGSGQVFLPMHIPILLAGFILGAVPAAVVGFLTVILSSALTGMPQVPVLYYMMVEVSVYGFMAGITYKKLNLNIYISLILSMIVGRIALALTVYALQVLLSLKVSMTVYMTTAIAKGIPGIIIQLLFIPILVAYLNKARIMSNEYGNS